MLEVKAYTKMKKNRIPTCILQYNKILTLLSWAGLISRKFPDGR